MAQQGDKNRDDWYQRWISGIADDVASNMEGEEERERRMDDLRYRLDHMSRRLRQARVAQHETDHLDGVLILDRATPEQRRAALGKLRPEPVLGSLY